MKFTTRHIGNIFDKHTGIFKIVVASILVFTLSAGAATLTSKALGVEKDKDTFADKESSRIANLVSEIKPTMQTTYCLPRIADIKKKAAMFKELDDSESMQAAEALALDLQNNCEKYAIQALSSFTK